MRTLVSCAALLTLLPACLDTSHTVNVAPSAEPQMAAIAKAVDVLNLATPDNPFVVQLVDSGERRDGEIVVRTDPDLATSTEHDGFTVLTTRGVTIALMPHANARTVAHELAHAAGLEHVSDPRNLMYPNNDGGWDLTLEQMEALR